MEAVKIVLGGWVDGSAFNQIGKTGVQLEGKTAAVPAIVSPKSCEPSQCRAV